MTREQVVLGEGRGVRGGGQKEFLYACVVSPFENDQAMPRIRCVSAGTRPTSRA